MRGILSLIRSGPRRGSDPNGQSIAPDRRPAPDSNQRRLYLLGTAFMARGMNPEDAYNKAVYYTKGSGRRQNWISALSEQDSNVPVLTSEQDSNVPVLTSEQDSDVPVFTSGHDSDVPVLTSEQDSGAPVS